MTCRLIVLVGLASLLASGPLAAAPRYGGVVNKTPVKGVSHLSESECTGKLNGWIVNMWMLCPNGHACTYQDGLKLTTRCIDDFLPPPK